MSFISNLLSIVLGQRLADFSSTLFLAFMVVCMFSAVSAEIKRHSRGLRALPSEKVVKLSFVRLCGVSGACVFGLAFMATALEFTPNKDIDENAVSDATFQEVVHTRVVNIPETRKESRFLQVACTTPGRLSESRAYGSDSFASQSPFVAHEENSVAPSPQTETALLNEIAPRPLSPANDSSNVTPVNPSYSNSFSRAYGSNESAVDTNVFASNSSVVATSKLDSSDVVNAFQPEKPLLPVCFPNAVAVNSISPTSFTTSYDGKYSARQIGVSELTDEAPVVFADDNLLTRLDEAAAKVNKELSAAVLALNVKRTFMGRVEEARGSGFVVQYKDRVFVITNNHVVEGAERCKDISISTKNGRAFSPSKIFRCVDFDIAALEIDRQTLADYSDLRLCRLSSSSKLEVGFGVFTVGSPLFLDGTATYCHVGKLYRSAAELKEARIIKDDSDDACKDLVRYIQISGFILEGNSGGPLFDGRGNVVGVVTASIQQDARVTGIGFAIPIEDALSVVRNMVDFGSWQRSYLGVVMDGSRTREYDILEHGVVLSEVKRNSPAELAGVKVGDCVCAFNGERVKNNVDLARMIALSKPGEPGEMGVLRDGRPVLVSFTTRTEARSSNATSSVSPQGTIVRR